jgi:hypothetical protein
MKRFVARADRGQSTLLPECINDWVDESNPVRYLNRVQSSRRLEREAGRNLEVMWLLG